MLHSFVPPDQSLCSYVDEYKVQLMPIITDNGAYVRYILHVPVEDNKQQMSGCLSVFIWLYPHSLPDTPTPGPFLSISPTDKHNRRLD